MCDIISVLIIGMIHVTTGLETIIAEKRIVRCFSEILKKQVNCFIFLF